MKVSLRNGPCHGWDCGHGRVDESGRSGAILVVNDTPLPRSPWAKFNVELLSETTRLHDYDATGNIKDNGDMVHALLRSVEEDLLLFGHLLAFLLQGLLFENCGGSDVPPGDSYPPLGWGSIK